MSNGILSQVSIAPESTFGTAVTPTRTLAVHTGAGIQTNQDVQFPEAVNGIIAKNTTAFTGKRTHEGEYEMDVRPGFVGYLLRSLFGGCSSALKSGESVVYEHTLTESETKPSLTVEQSVGEITRRYAGAIPTSMKLSVKSGESLVGSFSLKAKTSASATKISPAIETVRPWNFADGLTASGLKIGGSAYTGVASIELQYSNNGDMFHALGAVDPASFYIKPSEVKGKIELYLDSTSAAKYTDYINGVEQSLQVTFTGDSIGTSSAYKLDITIPRARFTAASNEINNEYCMLSIEFEGIYDTATSKLISAVLTNLTSAYTS